MKTRPWECRPLRRGHRNIPMETLLMEQAAHLQAVTKREDVLRAFREQYRERL